MIKNWSEAAEIRRLQIESGQDLTFNNVFLPLFLDYISATKPKTVLEIGAGTGHISKEIALLGIDVTAIEPAEGMYQIATEVLRGSTVNIKNNSLFQFTANHKFDTAIAHLVVHVIEDYEFFLEYTKKLLNCNGELVFTIPHPCFYNDYKKFLGNNYTYMAPMFKKVSFTITKDKKNVIKDVPYFHRPLSNYINYIINAGYELISFVEVYPDIEVQKLYGELWETARYCIFRCKNKT